MSTDVIQSLLELSHQLGGERLRMAILGEGNTSVRLDDHSFAVKASGSNLASLKESDVTRSVRHECQQQLMDCLSEPHRQLALICYLRFWAEVLVSVEYSYFWPRLSERLSHGDVPDRSKSEFFYHHMIHDSRQSDIGTDTLLGGRTHAQELGRQISRLIPNEEALACAMRQVDQACALKSRFYDQFLP
jgi:hypothetical protein